MATSAKGTSSSENDDGPYTPNELLEIITAPSGGMTLLPSESFDEVYPNLLIGEETIAKARVGLQKLGITHVLNAAEGKDDGFHVHVDPRMYQQVGIEYLGVPATDIMNFQLCQYFTKCADYIDAALKSRGKVLVNCKVGASRSATIVLAFLMIKRHLQVQDAVRLVRAKREICPNDGFLQQLCDLNETLKRNGHFQKKESV